MSLICDDIPSGITPEQITAYVEGLVTDGDFTTGDARDLINYVVSNGDTAGTSRDLIQIRRGNEVDLPELLQGELGFTLDTRKLYVGGVDGNVQITSGSITTDSWGLLGDGSDESIKFQQLVDYCISNDRELIVSDKTYLISNITITGNRLTISGNGTLSNTAGTTTLNVVNSEEITIKDIKIIGSNRTGVGVKVTNSYHVDIDSLQVENFEYGVQFVGFPTDYPKNYKEPIYVRNCNIYNCGWGIHTDLEEYITISENNITNCQMGIEGVFANVVISKNQVNGNIRGIKGVGTGRTQQFHSIIDGNTLNHNQALGLWLLDCNNSSLSVTNNVMLATNGPTPHTTSSYSFLAENCSNITISNNQMDGGNSGTASDQILFTNCSNIVVSNNVFYSSVLLNPALPCTNMIFLCNINRNDKTFLSGNSTNIQKIGEIGSTSYNGTQGRQDILVPTLLNGWANGTGAFRPLRYYKDITGQVHVNGIVTSGTLDATIFNLPVGFRPNLLVQRLCNDISGNTANVVIYNNGDVKINQGSVGNVFVDISFYTN